MKRVFDFTFALIGLLLLLPFIILIGLLIKLDDKGSVFFKQKRVGIGGRLFVLYKFRSIKVLESAKEGIIEPGNISRITALGKFLKKTKIDELPQLFNVLMEDMSLVSPRPEVEKWVAVYPERWKKVCYVKSGTTDNASIVYRGKESIFGCI